MSNLATAGPAATRQAALKPLPERQTPIMGLYMVQPYEPGKIPVLLVHGLWSSPMTWMEMFNDLRSSPEIRHHYQFWFYLYPTGQPFWISAAAVAARPGRGPPGARPAASPEPALDQMVLVGHSMGGLVAELQTLDSGNDYWNLASHEPLGQVRADPETLQRLHETFYLPAQPVDPPRGDHRHAAPRQHVLQPDHAIPAGQTDPPAASAGRQPAALFRDNPSLLFADSLLKIETSIDSLSPAVADLPGDAGRPAAALGEVPQHHRRDAQGPLWRPR